jgi:hypothetical protein
MNCGYYDNSMGRKHSAWQKYGFNVTAAGTCIYLRLETVKVIKYILCNFKAKKRRAGKQFSQWSNRLWVLIQCFLGAGKIKTGIFAVEGWV